MSCKELKKTAGGGKHDRATRSLTRFCKGLGAVVLFLFVATGILTAQATFTSLFDFDNADGARPYYVYLVQGTDGQLYGTAESGGGQSGTGTIYKIATDGTFTQLWTFCSLSNCADGDLPTGGLVMGTNGNFYGTTANTNVSGGSQWGGTIFEITPSGTFTLLHTFTGVDGSVPFANMILGTDGNFYGTTLYGGNLSICGGLGCGTVFKITLQGKFTSLYSFTGGADGQGPIGRLFQGANGNFYGTTIESGSGGFGTVFEITPTGKITTLYSFSNKSDGAAPYGGVIQTADGTLYGTTSGGGTGAYGTVFKLSSNRRLTTLYNFTGGSDGAYPYSGLIQASDGNFYGTTLGGSTTNPGGSVYEITAAGKFTTLYTFCSQPSCADGGNPYGGGLLQSTDGNLYGTTNDGGDLNSDGTIFKISNGLGPFVQTVMNFGKVGAPVTILGTNLTGATGVSFNNAAATFTVNSTGTSISTTVPNGATTGLITVATPSGSLASNSTFKVTPQIKSFTPPSGPDGTSVTITGVSLTQTSRVVFGGVPATNFTVNSDTEVTATVPTGAKTGRIMITTLGGSASSATSFTVTP